MNLRLKKFLAFEWLMFLIIGAFWAAAMFLPLFLTGSFTGEAELFKSLLIMLGPYLFYVVIRLAILLVKSVMWAYLVSSFLFTSEKEKKVAEEWILFVILGVLWAAIMIPALWLIGMLSDPDQQALSILLLLTPYFAYGVFRFAKLFFISIGWAVRTTTKTE